MPEKQNQNKVSQVMSSLTLGQATDYPTQYDASLLQPVPRKINRTPIGVDDNNLPFQGFDLWTCFELSWLQPGGLPAVAIAEVEVPATSPNLIESKSFKLYLNSYNQTCFENHDAVLERLSTDLSDCAGEQVKVNLYSLREYAEKAVSQPAGSCIDQQSVTIDTYDYTPDLLQLKSEEVVTETLYSDLLKSNCLITNQPDWGTVIIQYTGARICPQALLRYIVSFRNHNEFHEQCVERIFTDIKRICQPEQLSVFARYTRRGGLDINPFRSDSENHIFASRGPRQ